MGRSSLYTPSRLPEGVVIGSLNLYRIKSEAEFAAMQMGIDGAHPIEYQGETWYRPGDTPTAFEAVFHRPIQSFIEFIGDDR